MRCRVLICLAMAIGARVCNAELFEDFDGGGTTPFHLANSVGSPPMVIAGGPTGRFARLSDGTANTNNAVGFDENPSVTGPAVNGKILSIDFRLSVDRTSSEVAALGFGYAAIGPWGATGPRNPGWEDVDNDWDQPAFAGSAMVGIDLAPGGSKINLNAFEIKIAEVVVPASLDLTSGLFHRAKLKVVPNPADPTTALFDLDIIEDVHGIAVLHSIMDDVAANINLAGLPGNRVFSGATVGNLSLTADVDNISVHFIPEPSSLALAAFSCVLFSRRRRAATGAHPLNPVLLASRSLHIGTWSKPKDELEQTSR